MKRVAMIMALFLGIALGVGEALAASSREPVLERLKPLDAARAAELSETIAKGN